MGLDQYAFACKGDDRYEIGCWRKHANLEGWMSDLYRSRGGEGDFNCIELKLFDVDILNLEKEYQHLETATGFFWGTSRGEDDKLTQEFIANAKEAIEDGYEVIYTSWW